MPRRKTLHRLIAAIAAALLVIILAFGGLLYAFLTNFHHFAPNADYPAPRSALEAQRQDLDYFARAMALDRSFSPAARAKADARIAALKALPAPLPRARLQVALMQLMASADNGHSRLQHVSDQGGTLTLPVRVTRFAEGFYVMRAEGPYRDLLGGRVESIDGVPFDQVLSRLETLRGGVEAFRRDNAAVQMVIQDLLYGLGIAADPQSSTWTVRLPDGRQVTQRLTAYPLRKGDTIPEGDRWLSPEPAKGAERDWIALHPRSGGVPETWRDFDDHFRLFQAGCAKAIRLQNIQDTDGQMLAPFLTATETSLQAHPPCAVLLDLRGDTGGDYTKIWHFSHVLPDLLTPGGRIAILTDPLTFSAAITTTAFVKEAGGSKVTIVGEPVGDRLAFFSEGGKACLPNSKLCVFYQTARHDYAHACNDWHQCFWMDWLYPVRVSSLAPDIAVPLRFQDWNAGQDAAYNSALKYLMGKQKRG